MLLVYPFSFMFLSFTAISSILSLSSGHVLGVWVGFEVNTVSFISLMIQSFYLKQIESGMKYFLIQSLGSGFWLLGCFILYFCGGGWFFLSTCSNMVGLFFVAWGMIMKLGMFPVFFWVPSVMRDLNWFSCSVLVTWQKLVPLFILVNLMVDNAKVMELLLWFGMISAIVGGVGGLNQLSLRVLMAYSSIGHVGWMISVMCFSSVVCFIYYMIYFMVSGGIFFYLWFYDYMSFTKIVSWRVFGGGFTIMLSVMFLSLGGLPPFTGFIGKWLAMMMIFVGGGGGFLFFLLLGSLMNLYYYLVVVSNMVVWSGLWSFFPRVEVMDSLYIYVLYVLFFVSCFGMVFYFFTFI